MRRLARIVMTVAVLAVPTTAAGQGFSTNPSALDEPLHPRAQASDDIVDPSMRRSWDEGRVRKFAALTADVGFLYLRPRLSLGYGKPFQDWIGVDANPVAAGAGLGVYGGLRFALRWVDLRLGPRYFYSFSRYILAARDSYSRLDIDSMAGDKARTLTYEAELNASVPAGPGDILALGSASYVTGVSDDQAVFEETLRVIVRPPFVWRGRLGYGLRLGSHNQHSVGVVADILHVPKRDDSITVRAGPVLRIVLSRHFEVRGSFVVTVWSPDTIGLVGGDFTELGLRYRWATE